MHSSVTRMQHIRHMSRENMILNFCVKKSFHLRLAFALACSAGVMETYWAARYDTWLLIKLMPKGISLFFADAVLSG